MEGSGFAAAGTAGGGFDNRREAASWFRHIYVMASPSMMSSAVNCEAVSAKVASNSNLTHAWRKIEIDIKAGGRTMRPAIEYQAIEVSHLLNLRDFGQAKPMVEFEIGQILTRRVSYADNSLVIALTQQLAESRVKRTAGGYVILMFVLLAIYTLGMRTLLDIELKGSARTISSVVGQR
ncbi:MAG: hypothetical protein HOE54_04235 [Gammaproteobacteria bacterium]|jgi:hypothetical protein|nr:hypothetical protein [Gammaproteobacteria bacterium]